MEICNKDNKERKRTVFIAGHLYKRIDVVNISLRICVIAPDGKLALYNIVDGHFCSSLTYLHDAREIYKDVTYLYCLQEK